jgi:hypothetical protein
MKEFLGNCIGVRVQERPGTSPSFSILIEDDGNWSAVDVVIDTYWLDEMIEQLQAARKYIKKNAKKGLGYSLKQCGG